MDKIMICGTDLHDRNLVCRVAVDRDEPRTRAYPNTSLGKSSLLDSLKRQARKHSCERIAMAYEASTQGFCLHDDCVDAGVECFVLAPTKIRKSKRDQKRKADEKDAQLILETLRGHLLAGNELPSVWIPDDATRADRETVRSRLDLGRKLTAAKTQVRTLLKAHRLRKPEGTSANWTKSYRCWLGSLCGEGQWPALATLVRQIEFVECEIQAIEGEITSLSETPRYAEPYRALTSKLKGVGLMTAMVFLTEIGDMRRFPNRRTLGAFLGLVPSSNESGEKGDRKGHITREGSPRLRYVLCQATWSRVRSDPDASLVYDRIVRKNPKHKKIAAVAMMRRLGIRMWHVARKAQVRCGIFAPEQMTAGAPAA